LFTAAVAFVLAGVPPADSSDATADKSRYNHHIAQLAYGLFGKGFVESINGCIPKKWKTKGVTEKAGATPAKTKATAAVNKLEKVLGKACQNKIKSKLLKLLGGRKRHYSRNFIQKSKINPLKALKELKAFAKQLTGALKQFTSAKKIATEAMAAFKGLQGKGCKVEEFKNEIKKKSAKLKALVKSGGKSVMRTLINDILCKWAENKKHVAALIEGTITKDKARKFHLVGRFLNGILENLQVDTSSKSGKKDKKDKTSKKRKRGHSY